MADSNGELKDGGISDVLAEGEKQSVEQEAPSVVPETTQVKTENESLTGNKETIGNGEQGTSETSNDEIALGRTSPRSYSGELDLTDPNSVIQMLENVDLTEEDTEDLLQEAYSMNRKLKEMLRRQEMESSSPKPKLKSRSKSNADSYFSNGHGSSPGSASSAGTNSRNGSSFGIKKVLPPISHGEKETSVYTIKLRRAKTNIPEMKTTSNASVLRTKSSTQSIRKVLNRT